MTLDKVGNRDEEALTYPDNTNNKTITYNYNQRDQLTSVTDTDGLNITYDYDASGNQTEKTENGVTQDFNYTARQRVKSITIGGAPPIEYQYDYAGQRINIQKNGTEKRNLYDGLTLIAETNTLGNTIARYHYGQRHQVAETRNGQSAFYLADALGTNVAITNADGSIQNRMNYDVWGNLNQETGTSESPFGFTGYIKDEDMDLYYANARYYDSFTGRFLREDPFQGDVNTPPSLHRYLYANGNPTVYIDPDGRESIEEYSYFKSFSEYLGFTIPDDTDNSGRKSEMMTIRTAMHKQYVRESGGVNAINRESLQIAKSILDNQMTRVAESATNELFMELDIDKAEILKRAHLSNCVYNPDCNKIDKSIGNIERLRGSELVPYGVEDEDLLGAFSGFKAGIFKDHDKNEIIFAFAGTDDAFGDVYSDIVQAMGISVHQYDKARELAVRAALGAEKAGMDISFTGHSLGGGLASFASMVTKKKGTTFNSAGLNIFTAFKGLYAENLFENNGYSKDRRAYFNEYIDAIYVEGEALSTAQDFVPLLLPDAVGRRIPVQPGSSDGSIGQHGSLNVCRGLGTRCNYGKK